MLSVDCALLSVEGDGGEEHNGQQEAAAEKAPMVER